VIVRPHSILLDADALSALAGHQRRIQAWATVAQRTDSILYASTVTLTEVTDGSARDAAIRHTAKAVRLEAVNEQIGYRAGALRASAAASRRKARDLTVDAIIAATALALPVPAVVLTSDPRDLRLLLTGTHVKIESIN
jgi:predicted nucleic acid-binding protein